MNDEPQPQAQPSRASAPIDRPLRPALALTPATHRDQEEEQLTPPAPGASHPARALTEQDREAIRAAGADDARRSRAAHGLPERVEDPAAIARLAALLRDSPPPRRPPAQAT